ncbi:aspartic proteinase nepenthesin-2-like [Mercurialis annua]|uniref:aspartic proteinase nepenthesin-2-like n=1 Tax=Mercurialis annua TaxID=3986 RepID=UPI00215E991A|nr:aspartic proteinase nepenthesin-2-like [Mercurialis annua]
MASASFFLLALFMVLDIFTTISAISNSTLVQHSQSTSASKKILKFPMYHIGKFINNDSQSLSLARIRLQNEQRLIQKKDWLPGPFQVEMPLLVAVPTGEYIVELQVGSQRVLMLLDNGSPLVWWQCSPCKHCFQQKFNSLYNPSLSTSYKPVICPSNWCDKNTRYTFTNECIMNQCQYTIKYRDGSSSSGFLANETISSDDGMLYKSIIFGCASTNEGLFDGFFDGILGFQHSEFSFPNQIEAYRFSFCFVAAHSKFDGKIQRRPDSAPLYLYEFPHLNEDTTFVVTLTHLGHHYVQFEGIKINGEKIPIDAKYWNRDTRGKYGVVLDSGTPITRFPMYVYNKIRDSFRRSVTGKMSVSESEQFDTCFHSPLSTPVDYIPKVSLCFRSGKGEEELRLAPEHIMASIGNNTYCFAFNYIDTSVDITIIGSHQLQNTRLSFNMLEMSVSVTPDDC